MMTSPDDGEITFYEELGVAPNATPEQIRDAFRLFVRLLHPDQQTDPQLKEMAEAQMRKLNRVYAVLSDTESRLRYDEILDQDLSPPIIFNVPSPDQRRLIARFGWVAAIVVSAGLLFWLASDNAPVVQSRTAEPSGLPSSNLTSAPGVPRAPSTDDTSQASRVTQLQSALRAVTVERDDAVRELDKIRGTSKRVESGSSLLLEGTEPRPPLTIAELPSAPRLPLLSTSALSRIERPANVKLAGFWFYAKPPEGQSNKDQALYPPEYIEATITEEGGVIHGRYRSRFTIADRAISPDVNFTFSGTANGSQCSCAWVGAGGAKGDLTLKLASENSMRIDWIASELGTQLGLGSGTAVLTRRIE